MELGNMVFGHSRGQHRIPRREGWHTRFGYLRELLEERVGSDPARVGPDFENDTFVVRPYYWGECQCGYVEAMREFEESIDHRGDCYQTEKRQMEREAGVRDKSGSLSDELEYEVRRNRQDQIYDLLTDKYDLPRRGCAVHCTCDYHDRRKEKMEELGGHDDDCRVIQPNFYHKPTGLHVEWYKYPFRDAYMNMSLDLDEWNEIVEDCIDSVRGG